MSPEELKFRCLRSPFTSRIDMKGGSSIPKSAVATTSVLGSFEVARVMGLEKATALGAMRGRELVPTKSHILYSEAPSSENYTRDK